MCITKAKVQSYIFYKYAAFSLISTEHAKVGFGRLSSFCMSGSAQVLTLNVTTPYSSFTWNNRELATLLTLSENKFPAASKSPQHEGNPSCTWI